MNIGEQSQSEKPKKFAGTKSKSMLEHVPLAAPEDDSEDFEEAEYEQINDNFSDAVNNIASQLFTYPSQDPNGQRSKVRQRRGKETSKSTFSSNKCRRINIGFFIIFNKHVHQINLKAICNSYSFS